MISDFVSKHSQTFVIWGGIRPSKRQSKQIWSLTGYAKCKMNSWHVLAQDPSCSPLPHHRLYSYARHGKLSENCHLKYSCCGRKSKSFSGSPRRPICKISQICKMLKPSRVCPPLGLCVKHFSKTLENKFKIKWTCAFCGDWIKWEQVHWGKKSNKL